MLEAGSPVIAIPLFFGALGLVVLAGVALVAFLVAYCIERWLPR